MLNNTEIRLHCLSVVFEPDGHQRVLDDISMTFPDHGITGVIGESGSGKSVLGMSLLGLLPRTAQIRGTILYGGRDINHMTAKEKQELRRNGIALIPQNPTSALNPVMKINRQIREGLGPGNKNKIQQLMDLLHLSGKKECYPFQLSGGMKQRVLAAMGLIRNPAWLLADEPTKGLDARLRHEMFGLLQRIHKASACGIILISHDLPFARRLCRNIIVLYRGRLVEKGPAESLFKRPFHPYTRALIQALPRNGFTPIPGPATDLFEGNSGCPFHPRCPLRREICATRFPGVSSPEKDREVYCHAQG